jgi:uncharacterized phiE125 gp8 family phage protein
MALKIYAAPTEEPVFVDDATKLHLRAESDIDDDLIALYIQAARIFCEDYHGRKYITQTWDLYLDAFPCGDIILPYPPLQSVTHVKYKDTAGVLQTWAATNYVVDSISEPGRISLAYGISYPSTLDEIQSVQIRYVCGYGLASSVPMHAKQAILLKLADLYENRGDAERAFVTNIKDDAIHSLLGADRIWPV